MAASPRAFVLRHTRLRPVPGLEELQLQLADEILPLWHAVQVETDDPDAALPYWASAWGGGLAIGRYLREHPDVVAGRRVFDLASGSGICAISAMRAGAAAATGTDVDVFALAAIRLNARANGCRVNIVGRDVLDEAPPDADVILAGDCWYDAELARSGPAVARARTPSGDRGPRRRPWATTPTGRRTGGTRRLRRPNHDRARGSRANASDGLPTPLGCHRAMIYGQGPLPGRAPGATARVAGRWRDSRGHGQGEPSVRTRPSGRAG